MHPQHPAEAGPPMITARLSGIRLAGMVSAVPDSFMTAADDAKIFGEKDMRRILKNTGVKQRHVTRSGLCASDLMLPAAEVLLADLGWEKDSIQALVVVTQGPDYLLPATACVLQHRLGLSTSLAAFDINLGCSGFVYGLWAVSSLISSGLKRALLCVGDMSTRSASPLDRSIWPLFGDGASVAALEADAGAGPMTFVLGTDGRGAPNLILPVGGFRHRPRFPETSERRKCADGNVRSEEDVHMNGLEVLTFTLNTVPFLVGSILDAAGWSIEDVDHFVFHQASTFILKTVAAACKLPPAKVVIGMENWGNTSSASIPFAMCDKLRAQLESGSKRLLLAGFGVGWSWAGVALTAGPLVMPEILVVADQPPEHPLGPPAEPEPGTSEETPTTGSD